MAQAAPSTPTPWEIFQSGVVAPLSARDRLCLDCALPACREGSEQCRWYRFDRDQRNARQNARRWGRAANAQQGAGAGM